MIPDCSVFCGVSLDGFIAKPDGGLDWMKGTPGEGEEDAAAGDHGYAAFTAGIDVFVWGRKTFEKVMTFDEWYHAGKRVVVLSSKPLDLEPARARGADIERMSGTPAEIVARLGAAGAKHLYVDGGETVQAFLRAGLISRMIISRLPVLIGRGIPLFGGLERDVRLKLIASRVYPGGMVQSEYRVLP